MLQFNKNLELTFIENKVSKNGTQYQIVRFISENGSTIDCVYRGAMNLTTLALRKVYNIQFQFTQNKSYSTLEVIGISQTK